ncbi:MAG: hypothetical protein CML20_07245 [Rheinheimera sp.]|nr:hypothetical protein [Rheinheimera sp.]
MKKLFIVSLFMAVVSNNLSAKDVTLVVKKHGQNKYETIVVDESEVEQITKSNMYLSVEEEVWLSRPDIKAKTRPINIEKYEANSKIKSKSAAEEEYVPNDPDYSYQYYFKPKSEESGSIEILDAIRKSKQNKKLRVAVLDGGFHDQEDMEYSYGYNFFDEWGEVREPEFRDFDDQVNEATGCISGHGLSIASIIGAKSNNEIGISGIIDADLIALRVLSCGIGPMSDLADAIIHAAGGEVGDIPAIEKVDIINISISGPIGDCPTYVQEAIDYANEQGVMIFVAAGNNNEDISTYAPASCEGIYVSGATDKQGYKAELSNHGSVSSMSPGVDIPAYSARFNDGEITTQLGWWEGTSQASPITAAVAGLGLQHNPELSREEVFKYLKLSAEDVRDDVLTAEQDCATGRCGAGLINASRFMDLVVAFDGSTMFELRHALTAETSCAQELFISEFGNTLPLCEMYELLMPDRFAELQTDITLVRALKENQLIEDNVEEVIEITDSSMLLDSLDLENYQYATRICLDDTCELSQLIKLDVSNAVKPAACSGNN